MRKTLLLILVIALLGGCAKSLKPDNPADSLFQHSVIDALLAGDYDGSITVRELKARGGFAIGTWDGLDGEMVALDGIFYKIKTDGLAYPMPDEETSPFAVVARFLPDGSTEYVKDMDCEALRALLDRGLITKNHFYAIRVSGEFELVKARSVPKQTEKPYKALVEVVKEQSVFDYKSTRGTLVGFRAPSFVKGVNVPGYHFHYLTQERNAGGHVLKCHIKEALLEVDRKTEITVNLPKSGDFMSLELDLDRQKELHSVETEDR